jgi:hypothetical protein
MAAIKAWNFVFLMGIFLNLRDLELSLKWHDDDDQGARTASFSIIGHQTHNWQWKHLQIEITVGPQLVFPHEFWW